MKLTSALLLAAILPASMPALAANPTDKCPKFATPKKMKVQSVAEQMDYNGFPMSIYRFDSEEDMANIFAFYRQEWASTDPARKPAEYPLGEWQAIASMRDPCFYTVQVKPRGRGSEGLLGVTAPPADRMPVKEEVPMLPGSKILNDIAHTDSGKQARTLLLKNTFSADANADFYRRNLGDKGWKMVSGYGGSVRDTRANTMVLQQKAREVSITITQKGSTSNVLLNFMDQP
jgi:hypothetical protein